MYIGDPNKCYVVKRWDNRSLDCVINYKLENCIFVCLIDSAEAIYKYVKFDLHGYVCINNRFANSDTLKL